MSAQSFPDEFAISIHITDANTQSFQWLKYQEACYILPLFQFFLLLYNASYLTFNMLYERGMDSWLGPRSSIPVSPM